MLAAYTVPNLAAVTAPSAIFAVVTELDPMSAEVANASEGA